MLNQEILLRTRSPRVLPIILMKTFKTLIVSLTLLLIISTFAVVIVFYSPYTYLKELFVTTAMSTMDHQYLAKLFVSDAEIKRIMDDNKMKDPTENTKSSQIIARYKGSDDITLVKISEMSYQGYLLIVKDPSKVCIATTDALGKRGMHVEDIVKKNDAIAGINAGGFLDVKGHGSGGIPLGVLIKNGKILKLDGTKKQSIIGFNKDNVLILGNYTPKQIKNLGLRDAISFKPFLIINGHPQIDKGNGGQGIQPRTAIGQTKDGTVLLLVIDGRQLGSLGATLKDVQDIMLSYGAHNAANLDGGSSTTLIYDNEIINNPCSSAGPRYVPTAFIVEK